MTKLEYDIDIKEEDKTGAIIIPTINEPEWQAYVMSLFADDEKYKGRPKVHGLRRVTELLIGEILESYSDVIKSSEFFEDNRLSPATVTHTIVIKTHGGTLKTFRDVADTHAFNTPDSKFAVHTSASASTRARARTLRSILNLAVTSADEVSDKEPEEKTNVIPVEDTQVHYIDKMCLKLDINPEKICLKCKCYFDLDKDTAAQLIYKLGSTDKKNVSADIKGYSADWMNSYKKGERCKK